MLFGKTAEQIEHPGPRVTAIGKLAVYPPDHPKAGEIVEDEAIRARAVDNYRKLSDSYVRLTGAALAPPGTGLNEDQVRMMAEIIVARRDRAQQAPPLPPGYSHMTPHQQAEADLDRRRTQHDAEQAAITAGHDDVVDAEIVD